VGEEGGNLYGGSHPVPDAADWDGDGRTDLIVGNADGHVLFHRNVGTDAAPRFMPGVPLRVRGEPIHVQPGYVSIRLSLPCLRHTVATAVATALD